MGIVEQNEEIIKLLKEQGEGKKKFRYPFGKKVGKAQKKKNYVTVIKVNENGALDFKKLPIDNQTIMEDGIPRLAAAGYVYHHKKNPVIILPSWSVEPFSAAKHYKESLLDGSNTKGYEILLAKMEKETIKPKAQLGGTFKWIIGIGLAAIIAYAFLTGGG